MNHIRPLTQLISDSLALQEEGAREAGALGFLARALVQATMPHRDPKQDSFVRKNGAFTLSMYAAPSVGLPYGSVPRLLMAWITAEAVRTRSRELVLGDSLTAFMRELGLAPTGGQWGSITRLRMQSHKLFSCTVSCLYQSNVGGDRTLAEMGFRVADKHIIFWDTDNTNLIRPSRVSTVVLSQMFYDEIVYKPVPIDMRALHILKQSPLAIDIYVWMTYRLSYLRRDTVIPWAALETQFGSEYSRTVDFRIAFSQHLGRVLEIYKAANVVATEAGLVMKPSQTHVARW